MSAEPASHLRLVRVDDETGEVEHVESRALEQLEAELEKLRGDLKNAERDLRAKRRRISELERDKVRERLDHPDREFIVRVCKYWHKRCRRGSNRIDPLAPNRFDAVAALAEMEEIVMVEVDGRRRRERRWRYSAEQFKAAIDGGEYDPFETTHKNGRLERHNDLAQICKDVTRFERFVSKAPYEVQPLAGFTRLSPVEVARAREKRDDERREFHPPLLSAARHGGSYVHTWPGPGHAQLPQAVGAAHGVSPRRLESGGLLVWSRVAGCDEVAPAVWA
jgi:hypothetical protein